MWRGVAMSEKSPLEEIEKIKKKNSSGREYKLTYDSLSEGLEPIYFWILDFMQDSGPAGLGMDEVLKSKDEYEAAVGSGYFGEMGSRISVMQDRALKMMATINTVIRSIINLIYDLREFDIRLSHYNYLHSEILDKKESAKLSLKQVWMDQVDVKRGRGSINMLAQQLDFVTLRDAFMNANSESQVSGMDLNARVKRILKPRVQEYLEWEKNSESELRKRYNIEKSYLKSQVNSLKFYTKWVKPYLIAAKKLGMAEFTTQSGRPSPNLVNVFNNLEMQLSLLGIKEIKPEDLGYSNLKTTEKFYACVEAEIKFRTVPKAMPGQSGAQYIHAGRTDIVFRSYALTKEELDKIQDLKDKEDLELIEGMTDTSLKEIEEDLQKYIEPEKIEKEEKKEFKMPFSDIGKGFRQTLQPIIQIGTMFKNVFKKKAEEGSSIERAIRKKALETAEQRMYIMYDVYKKAHGMVTW
ncbi:hypothetical protein K8R47_01575 [archaeon]|nr:hypothetical protein [archaeon]